MFYCAQQRAGEVCGHSIFSMFWKLNYSFYLYIIEQKITWLENNRIIMGIVNFKAAKITSCWFFKKNVPLQLHSCILCRSIISCRDFCKQCFTQHWMVRFDSINITHCSFQFLYFVARSHRQQSKVSTQLSLFQINK